MKANEEPEKIYCIPTEGGCYYITSIKPEPPLEPPFTDVVEYTRTDAFIEKAATWIANRYQANGSYLCADDIDDFRKYMKGEQLWE